jgi:TetR/AcrR family transcriptional regulator
MNPEITKQRILEATDQLFGTLGFDGTTTRDIAERSGVNKALIHYHFGTKDDLLVAVLDQYYGRLTGVLAAALARPARTLTAQVAHLVDAYADFLAQNRAFCNIVQREVGSGQHVDTIVAGTMPMFQLSATWLGAVAPATPPGLELVHVLTSIYGVVVTYFTYGRVLERLTGQDPFTPAALESRRRHVHRVVELLLRELHLDGRPSLQLAGGGPPPPAKGQRKGRQS